MAEALPSLSVKRTKVTDYLLAIDHPEGGSKAKFFIGHGFTPDDPREFIQELFWHAHDQTLVRSFETIRGKKFVFEGPIITPGKHAPIIRSIWLQRPDSKLAELVTAYPA